MHDVEKRLERFAEVSADKWKVMAQLGMDIDGSYYAGQYQMIPHTAKLYRALELIRDCDTINAAPDDIAENANIALKEFDAAIEVSDE